MALLRDGVKYLPIKEGIDTHRHPFSFSFFQGRTRMSINICSIVA